MNKAIEKIIEFEFCQYMCGKPTCDKNCPAVTDLRKDCPEFYKEAKETLAKIAGELLDAIEALGFRRLAPDQDLEPYKEDCIHYEDKIIPDPPCDYRRYIGCRINMMGVFPLPKHYDPKVESCPKNCAGFKKVKK